MLYRLIHNEYVMQCIENAKSTGSKRRQPPINASTKASRTGRTQRYEVECCSGASKQASKQANKQTNKQIVFQVERITLKEPEV